MAEYEKVKRITIPINDDGLILVSAEPSVNHETITKEILSIRDKYQLEWSTSEENVKIVLGSNVINDVIVIATMPGLKPKILD